MYIFVGKLSIYDNCSCWYHIPTICLYIFPNFIWTNQFHYLLDGCIHSLSSMGSKNHVLVILPMMFLHSSLSVLFGYSLGSFRLLDFIGPSATVIIQSHQIFTSPVAMSNHRMACKSFLNQLNRIMYYFPISSISSTFSIM